MSDLSCEEYIRDMLKRHSEAESGWTTFAEFTRTGSSYTCNPPTAAKDDDAMIVVEKSAYDEVYQILEDDGFGPCEDEDGAYDGCDTHFISFRRDRLNILLTDEYDFYTKFRIATNLARKYNLMKKEDRIQLFQAVLYANDYGDYLPAVTGGGQ